jgi:hypothetical protein
VGEDDAARGVADLMLRKVIPEAVQ